MDIFIQVSVGDKIPIVLRTPTDIYQVSVTSDINGHVSFGCINSLQTPTDMYYVGVMTPTDMCL